jgi:ADP-ribose pyrophosphatase YjhB (NUDIX family)
MCYNQPSSYFIILKNFFMPINVRPAVLIIENQQVLTMQYNYGGQEVYNLPGGNLELGEYLCEALSREMQEELGIEVAVGEMILVGEVYFEDRKKHTLHLLFEGKVKAGIPTLNHKETSALGIKWLNISDLDTVNLYPNLSKSIQDYLAGKLNNKYIGKIDQQWF